MERVREPSPSSSLMISNSYSSPMSNTAAACSYSGGDGSGARVASGQSPRVRDRSGLAKKHRARRALYPRVPSAETPSWSRSEPRRRGRGDAAMTDARPAPRASRPPRRSRGRGGNPSRAFGYSRCALPRGRTPRRGRERQPWRRCPPTRPWSRSGTPCRRRGRQPCTRTRSPRGAS